MISRNFYNEKKETEELWQNDWHNSSLKYHNLTIFNTTKQRMLEKITFHQNKHVDANAFVLNLIKPKPQKYSDNQYGFSFHKMLINKMHKFDKQFFK